MDIVDWLREQVKEHSPTSSVGLLLTQAADTIAAQARLLELAGTLAGAVKPILCNDETNNVPGMQDTCLCGCDALHDAFDAFTAAQAEYQATGKVPCPECAKWQTEARTLGETIDELLKASGSEHKRLMKAVYGFNEDATFSDTLTVIEKMRAERDDLRRQLEHQTKEADDYGRWLDQAHNERDKAQADADGLRRQLAEAQDSIRSLEEDCARIIRQRERLSERNFEMARERDQAQADNAALVEALSKYGEHTGGDSETGKGNKTSCGCGLWNILSRPHPGAGLLEELAALRKVAEAARYATDIKDVYNALVDLDAHDRKKQADV